MNPSRVPLCQWPLRWKAAALPALQNSIQLLLLLLSLMCYLFGASSKQTGRYHSLKILVESHDDGLVGAAVKQAAADLQSTDFPTVEFRDAANLRDDKAARGAVCRKEYWAAMVVHDNSSKSLLDTLNGTFGDSVLASSVTYIYNQARYPTIADSVLLNSLRQIHSAAREELLRSILLPNATTLDHRDPGAMEALINPIGFQPHLIQPTTHTSRVFYNTVNIVIPTLAQFFFCLALNIGGLMSGFLRSVRVTDVYLFRLVAGKIYSIFISIVVIGYIWAFRDDWSVDGDTFGKMFLVYVLYMDVQWQLLESVTGTYVYMMFMPYFLLTWIVINVASTIFPLELQAGFYRIGWAMPAHHLYSLLVYVWSGCANPLKISLPVLFSWWVVLHATAVFSVKKRCHDAAAPGALGPPTSAVEGIENASSEDSEDKT